MKRALKKILLRIGALMICPLLSAAAALPSYAEENAGVTGGDPPEYAEMYYDGTPGCIQIGEPVGTAALVPGAPNGRAMLKAAATPEGSSVYIAYNGKWINYDSYTTPMFTAQTETGTYIALCTQPDTKQPPDGATWTVGTISNDLLKSILLLTPGNELYLYHGDNIFHGASEDEKYAYIHALLGLVYQGSITGLTEEHVQEIQGLLATIRNALESDDQFGVEWRRTIKKYRLYVAYTGEPYQDVMWVEPTSVSLRVQKTSSDASYGASLSGAVFAIYDSEENAKEAQRINRGRDKAEPTGKEIATLETYDDGSTDVYETAMGEYWAYELQAPQGFLRNEECSYVNASGEGEAYVLSCADEPSSGTASVIKTSADPAITENNSLYSMEGIRYTIYTDPECTDAAKDTSGNPAVITLKEDGTGSRAELGAGTYYVKETEVPPQSGYAASEEIKEIRVAAGGPAVAEFKNSARTLPFGMILQKKDADSDGPQGNASLEGAEYTLTYYDNYTGEGDPVKKWIFRTDEEGRILLDKEHKVSGSRLYTQNGRYVIPAGTVTIRETKAPEGYRLDPQVYTIRLKPGEDGQLICDTGSRNAETGCQDAEILSAEEIIRGGVRFSKIDEETKGLPRDDKTTLEGAVITIYNNSEHPVMIGEHTAEKGEEAAVVVTDAEGIASAAADLLPYGSYFAKETQPSQGYALNPEWRCDFEITEDGVIVDKTDEGSVLLERLKRADIRVLKLDIDGAGMAGIPFRISLLDENGDPAESHIIRTDQNGCFDTSRRPKTGDAVNSLDQAFSEDAALEETVTDAETGVWFGEQTARAEGRGSLIYGNYKIEELPCAANRGMELLSQELLLEEDENDPGRETFEDGRVYDLSRTFINLRIHPETDLTDDASGSGVVTIGDKVTVTDRIHYDHLRVGTEYMIRTEIYYIDKNGNSSLLGQNVVNFVPSEMDETLTACGTLASQVEINTEGLQGGIIAAADTFYVLKDGTYYELVSHNKDLTEERQMLAVPEPEPVPEKTPVPEETPVPSPEKTPAPAKTLTPSPVTVQTGDANGIAKWVVLLLAAAAGITAAAVNRKSSR